MEKDTVTSVTLGSVGDLNTSPIMLPSKDFIKTIKMELEHLKVLYSPLLRNCLTEIIDKMTSENLMRRIGKLNDVLSSEWLAAGDTNIIFEFFSRVITSREDAEKLFPENIAHMVEKAMSVGDGSSALSVSTAELIPPVPSGSAYDTCALKDLVNNIIESGVYGEIMEDIRPLYNSSNSNNKLMGAIISAGLLAHPNCIVGESYDQVMHEILTMLSDENYDIRLHALHSVQNFILASRDQAVGLTHIFIKTLLKAMNIEPPELVPMYLRTLLAVVRMHSKKTWHKFDQLLYYILRYLKYDDEDINLQAIILYTEIVRRYRIYPCSHITTTVKEQCLTLMVLQHSSNADISSAAAVCLSMCMQHLGCKATALDGGIDWSDGVYRALARKHLLKPLLIKAVRGLSLCVDFGALVRFIIAVHDYIWKTS